MSARFDEEVPVLIVGAGPTGLSAALFLAWHGVRSTVVEQHAATSTHPKARAINPRTMELFRSIGIEQAVRDGRSPISGNTDLVHVETLAGAERVRMPSASPEDISRISPTRWTMIDQNQLEPILAARARAVGVDLRFRSRVQAVAQDRESVTAQVKDRETGTVSRIRARYLVAADGSRSPIRQLLGVPGHGRGVITNLVSVFFEANLDEALRGRRIIAAYVNNPEVRGTIIPIDNVKRWVLNVSFFPERGQSTADFTEERCVELVRAAVGQPDLSVQIETTELPPWDISASVADRFVEGRVLVAGDAAHVMPPTGAFGASTGIQDAYNLAWKLALISTGAAGPGLVDSYDAERRPVAEETVRQAMLRFSVRQGGQLTDVADELVDEATMTFGYCYPQGEQEPLLEDPMEPSARPGARAPHATVTRSGEQFSVVDLFGWGFVLLVTGAALGMGSVAERVARALDVPLAVHLVGPGQELEDVDGSFAVRYGITDGGAVLVRPDGFVAWRAGVRPDSPSGALTSALRHLLDRPA